MKISSNGIDIEVEDSAAGPQQALSGTTQPVILLIMGMGMQLVAWPPRFIAALRQAGYRVLRFDNRDVGLSQHMDLLGAPHLVWESLKFKLGWGVHAPYSLHDMAADALGVLDALHVARAHVLGVSMGGMIAQRLALLAPRRVLSLTSVMSSSGAAGLPAARPEVLRVLLSRPPSRDHAAVVEHYVRLFQVIGSPAYPMPASELRQQIELAARRGYDPAGTLRQLLAVMADRQRADELCTIRVPTLVVHGSSDPLLPLAHGEDTVRRIPAARWLAIDGMGHDLAPGVVTRLLEALLPHLQAADRQQVVAAPAGMAA